MGWNSTIEAELPFLNPSKNLDSIVNNRSVHFSDTYKGRTMIMVKAPKKMPINVTIGAR